MLQAHTNGPHPLHVSAAAIPNAHAHRARPPPPALPTFERVRVDAIPAVAIQDDRLVVVGDAYSTSIREYTPIKKVGDGSFGTVELCDWHGPLPPNTPLSAMQRNAGARPEYAGRRLVAVKRMKKQWSGWQECENLKELQSLRIISYHPNIIPLYDFFLRPDTKELYFVFESMEGNLYQLIRSRRNRPLAGGLVASIFQQVITGLDHIHAAGYFHRDMKPENLLVTTTGLFDYPTLNPFAPAGSPPEKDVVVIVKIADFGLAREIASAPPYTDYVSTRWYRAPEVLLRGRAYSSPVDLWAFGAIMAELVDLRPLFPGKDEMDQVWCICQLLGDPSDAYGADHRGRPLGGGRWDHGVELAARLGCTFPPSAPLNLFAHFNHAVPVRLVECIVDLLRYDPAARLTARQCVEHQYLRDAARAGGPVALPPGLRASASEPNMNRALAVPADAPPVPALPPLVREVPPSHSHSPAAPAFNAGPSTHRTAFYGSPTGGDPAVQSPTFNLLPQPAGTAWPASTSMPNIAGAGDAMDTSPIAGPSAGGAGAASGSSSSTKPAGKFKKPTTWGRLFRGHGDKALPAVDEAGPPPTLKRSPTGSSHGSAHDQKAQRKEAERVREEAERQRRALQQKAAKDQARAVMNKQRAGDGEWQRETLGRIYYDAPGAPHPDGGGVAPAAAAGVRDAASGVVRQAPHHATVGGGTLAAAGGRYASPPPETRWRGDPVDGRLAKVRRRDWEDDHSVSSSDMRSLSRMSAISFATIDSDPGPARLRHRPSLFGGDRMTSTSSLRTSLDTAGEYARSVRSLQQEQALADQLDAAGLAAHSPPPLHALSLAAAQDADGRHRPPYLPLPGQGHARTRSGSPYASPGFAPKSAINPMFHVPVMQLDGGGLPPFAQLEAVAEGECPPLSPVSFYRPEDPRDVG